MSETEFKSIGNKEIFKHFYKKKLGIILIPLVVSIIVAIITLFIPNKYTSYANLLPSQRPSIGLDLFSESGGISSLASSVFGSAESDDFNRYTVLLSSYSTRKEVVENFDLISVYELEESKTPLSDAISILAENSSFEGKEEGNFVISTTSEDPILAKNITDYYIELLNRRNTEILSKDAFEYRKFIENRYNLALSEADSLEKRIIKFQQDNGVFELNEQVVQYFSVISALTVQQLEAEMMLSRLERQLDKTSDLYIQALSNYETVTDKLEDVYSDNDVSNLLLNFDLLPEIGADYVKLQLELEIQTELIKFVLPIYEQAKMEEAKSLPIVTIIDAPRTPEKKSTPKRSVIVISTGISTGILMLLFYLLQLNYTRNRAYYKSLLS